MALMQEKKQKKKNKTASGSVGPAEPKINGEPATEGKQAEQGLSEEDEEEEVRSSNSLESPAGRWTKYSKRSLF